MVASLSYYLYVKSTIQTINNTPIALKEFAVNGLAFAHDEREFYIINKSSQPLIMLTPFKGYSINEEKGEVVICQNLISAKPRRNTYQLIKVPQDKYHKVVSNNKLKIRVKYAFLNKQYALYSYDFRKKSFIKINEFLVGK